MACLSSVVKGEKASAISKIIFVFDESLGHFSSLGVWRTIVIEFFSPLAIDFRCSLA
jgi:hypothetical protein